MKHLFFSLFTMILSFQSQADSFDRDSTENKSFIHNFSLGFNWGEMGRSFLFEQKKTSTLDYGLEQYMSDTKGSTSFGFLGMSIAFKDNFGIEGLFTFYEAGSDGTEFTNYISAKHPGYYIPEYLSGNNYSIGGFGLRIFYRKHFKHFFIEPKFQVIFNAYSGSRANFRLKEIGSNQYIQYEINREIHGYKNSYHMMFVVARRFNPFKSILKLEAGLSCEFMICPIKQTFSITEKAYGTTGTTNSETFKLYNPAFVSSFILRFYLGSDMKNK